MFFKKKEIKEDVAVKTGDYIVVIHNWFVDSKGFQHHVFKNMELEQVKKEAAYLVSNNHDTFNKCAYHIIKVEE